MNCRLRVEETLPADGVAGTLIGRVWTAEGPHVVVVREDGLFDLTRSTPLIGDILDAEDPAARVRGIDAPRLASLGDVLANSGPDVRRSAEPHLLAPVDLQALKAAGVTFVRSMLERVIEERTRGDAAKALEIRKKVEDLIGGDIRAVEPGSKEALKLKDHLIEQQMWSQYLEVGIGVDAEIFSKAQPTSAVGHGAEVGIHPRSTWNNPEPEVVLVVSSTGRIVGATLGNDVNLRDFEGRSALLLSKAKDNNASCAIGPFIRLFDDTFGLDDVRKETVSLTVEGEDGFRLEGTSSMSEISRDPTDLVSAMMGKTHQYPDGAVLFCGTMFAPTEDRDVPGEGFTHKVGDIVTITSPGLGGLSNRVQTSDKAAPWTFGAAKLMRNLAGRGLL